MWGTDGVRVFTAEDGWVWTFAAVVDHRPPRLDLAQYPHLPAPRVTTTVAADYLTLLGVGAE